MSKEINSMNTKGNLKLSLMVALILVAMLLGSVAASASGQQPTSVKVLIAFAQRPGPAEQALVRSFGGVIKYTYHLVPAIAASVPEVALDGLRRNPRVVAVEPDLEVHVIDAELDNTSDAGRAAYAAPASTQGPVYVRDTDSDHSAGHRVQDIVYADHPYVRSETQPGDPPANPTDLSTAAIWIDLTC